VAIEKYFENKNKKSLKKNKHTHKDKQRNVYRNP
jgi:hypothetical protein